MTSTLEISNVPFQWTPTEDERWEMARLSLAAQGGPRASKVLSLLYLCEERPPIRSPIFVWPFIGPPVQIGEHELRSPVPRRPKVSVDDDGVYHLTWAFPDLSEQTFAIEVDQDGKVEWFYRDRTTDTTLGTEDEKLDWIPEEALVLLHTRFAA
jgi:hypothetical protein